MTLNILLWQENHTIKMNDKYKLQKSTAVIE